MAVDRILMEKTIKTENCYYCDKPFDKEKNKHLSKTEHHMMPKMLKSKNNVKVWVHRKPCHEEINNIYVNQQKKSRVLNITKSKLQGIERAADKFHSMVKKAIEQTSKEIEESGRIHIKKK